MSDEKELDLEEFHENSTFGVVVDTDFDRTEAGKALDLDGEGYEDVDLPDDHRKTMAVLVVQEDEVVDTIPLVPVEDK